MIWNGFKEELQGAISASAEEQVARKEISSSTEHKSSKWHRVRPFLSTRFLKICLRILADLAILFGLLFSMIISPLTIVAFVVWIEWWINNDGPAQENPQQVGQWSYLVSIGLLLLSAAILTLKYRLATASELDIEIAKTKKHLAKLEGRRDALSQSETVVLMPDEHGGS